MSVGLPAASITKHHGVAVSATPRKAGREVMLRSNGSEHVIIDDGEVAKQSKTASPTGINKS